MSRPTVSLCMKLAKEAADLAQVPLSLVLSSDKRKALVWCRHRVFRQLVDLGYSRPGIAEVFGLDQSSVTHAIMRDPPFTDEPPPLKVSRTEIRRALAKLKTKAEPTAEPIMVQEPEPPRNQIIYQRRTSRPQLLPSEFRFDPQKAMCGHARIRCG